MSTIIVLAYQHQTDQLNRSELTNELSHLISRIQFQQRVWDDDADHILDIIEWSGLLNQILPANKAKLQAFFSAQADSMEFEGIAITDAGSGKLVFDFWNNAETPDLQHAMAKNQPLWYDDKRAILYTKIHKSLLRWDIITTPSCSRHGIAPCCAHEFSRHDHFYFAGRQNFAEFRRQPGPGIGAALHH